jgi:ribosome production factor 2
LFLALGSKVNLASLDHVLCFTVAPSSSGELIHLRTYALELRKPASDSGSSVPHAKLVLSAPSVDFRVRRTRWAAKELMKHALKQPREVKTKKVKNVSTTALGDKVGQLHMQRQDYSALQTRKVKALFAHKALPLAKASGPGAAADEGGVSSGGEGVDEDDQ